MLSRAGLMMLVSVAGWLFAWTSVAAQSPNPPPKSPAETTSPPKTPAVREVKPETFYLRRADGELVPVPNLPFEEFNRLYQLELNRNDNGPSLPAFTLQEMSIAGAVSGAQAQLDVTLAVRLQQEGWIRVPLRFAEAILREPPTYRGDGDLFIDFEQQGAGYVCWIQAGEERIHRISMKLSVEVREIGEESRLDLSTPRATSSELRLQVPQADASATVSNGLLEVHGQAAGTEFQVAGLGGDFEIAWRQGQTERGSTQPLLEVGLETLVKADGLRQVGGDIRLSVSSLRGDFSSFTVRLPATTRLVSRQFSQPGLRISEDLADDGPQTRLVKIRLDRPTEGPVSVQLLTEYTPTRNGQLSQFELGGVEVEDAIRQSGHMDFSISKDLRAVYAPGPDVQQTLVPDSVRDTVNARFELVKRSFAFRLQLESKATQVSVDPLYIVYAEPGLVRLEATLDYTVRGAEVPDVKIFMPQWKLNRLGPEALVGSEDVNASELEPLVVPLTTLATAEPGQFTLQFSAEQSIRDDDQPLRIVLPRLVEKSRSPALVVIVPADNVQLDVLEGDLQGLQRESFPPQVELPDRQQLPFFYRERGDGEASIFVAEMIRHQRAISLRVDTQLDMASDVVEQTFRFHIAYEPLRKIELDVPRQLLDGGNLQFLSGTQALPFQEMQASQNSAAEDVAGPSQSPESGAALVRLQVDLLEERIGSFEFQAIYPFAFASSTTAPTEPIRVPLLVAADSDELSLTTSTLSLESSRNFQARLEGSDWKLDHSELDTSATTIRYIRRTAAAHVDVRLTLLDQPTAISTTVLRAWYQTWLGYEARRDRAVFRISTNQEQILVRPPDGVRVDELVLDGQLVPVQKGESQIVRLSSSDDLALREHVVELITTFPGRRPGPGGMALTAATVDGASWTRSIYWQLLTPAHEHLLVYPRDMTPELSWKWRQLYWARSSRLDQRGLERWVGTGHREIPTDGFNQYLFSSFGDLSAFECRTASRTVILLAISGATLVGGLLLLYIPLFRQPGLLFVFGVGLITATLMAPDLALGAVQAAYLGLALILLAGILKWLVHRREMQRTVIGSASYASPDSQTVRALLTPGDSSARSPTATTAVHVGVPLGEPQP